jgi:site-specific DNA-cytosine methylase
MKMLDLFSGLGGASQAFEAAGWEVVTVDINPEFNPTICRNIEDLWLTDEFKSWQVGEFDLIWASPPCVEFYKVNAPWFEEYGRTPSLDLVECAKAIINILQPKHWVIENTKSGMPWIKKILGQPRQNISGVYYLWGDYPLFDAKVPQNHKALNDPGGHDPLRSNKRAKIPLEISRALLDVIENQSDLSRWLN